MPFLVGSIKGKGAGGSQSALNQLNNSIEVLDLKYKDFFTGEITNKEYFQKKAKLYQNALANPRMTANQKNNIVTNIASLNKDAQKWAVTNEKLYKVTQDELTSQIDDNWNSLWKNKDVLRSGNFAAMAEGMIFGGDQGIDAMVQQMEDFHASVSELTSDEKVLAPIEKNIEYLEDQEEFWRGVATFPENYAAVVDSNADGSISNLQVKNIGNTSGYKNVGQKVGGIALYGKPHPALTDDEGNQAIVIGRNTFKGGDGLPFELEGEGEFDVSSFTNVPFGNYAPGTVLQPPKGGFLVSQNNGDFVSYQDVASLNNAGYSQDSVQAVTQDELTEINNLYNIDSAVKIDKQREIDEKMQAIRNQYEPQNSAWYQFAHMNEEETGEILGESLRSFATLKGPKKAVEAVAGAAGRRLQSTLETGQERIAELEATRVRAAKSPIARRIRGEKPEEGPKEPSTIRRIFRGIFTGLRGQ